MKDKSIAPDLKAELGSIKTTVENIEKRVIQFSNADQVAETSISKITPVIKSAHFKDNRGK